MPARGPPGPQTRKQPREAKGPCGPGPPGVLVSASGQLDTRPTRPAVTTPCRRHLSAERGYLHRQ